MLFEKYLNSSSRVLSLSEFYGSNLEICNVKILWIYLSLLKIFTWWIKVKKSSQGDNGKTFQSFNIPFPYLNHRGIKKKEKQLWKTAVFRQSVFSNRMLWKTNMIK